MPDVQQFIIAPDKRAQGTAADLAAFVAAAKAHPDVTLVKHEEGYAKLESTQAAVEGLMQRHGANLMMAVDAMLKMPEPPGPNLGKAAPNDPGPAPNQGADTGDEEDNIL